MSHSATLMTLMNAAEGCEDEFNEWYGNVHLKDVLSVPGFLSAKRFKTIEDDVLNPSPSWTYMTIYQIDRDMVTTAFQELRRRIGAGEILMSPSITSERLTFFFDEVPQ